MKHWSEDVYLRTSNRAIRALEEQWSGASVDHLKPIVLIFYGHTWVPRTASFLLFLLSSWLDGTQHLTRAYLLFPLAAFLGTGGDASSSGPDAGH